MKIWQTKKLGEVCGVVGGGTPNTSILEYWTDEIVWVTPKDLGHLDSVEIFNSSKKISSQGLKKSSTKLLPIGSVILSSRAPIGYVAIAGVELATNQGCRNFICSDQIDNKYLYYFLRFNTDLLNQLGGGSTFKEISGSKLKEIEISFPSILEQRRIVKIIDEVFDKTEKAKENAEKNLQNAKELFESYLMDVFENPENDWKIEKLGKLTFKIGSGSTPRGGKASYKTAGISLVRSMNVHDRKFKDKNLAFIDAVQAENLSNVTLEDGDVLLNITGASVARCCVLPKEYLPARVNQHVSIIRPKKELLDSRFLNYLLTSKYCKDRLLRIGEQGATRQAITKAQLESFEISCPILSEQKSIVSRLDALSVETKKLEAIYKQKIANLEELKKSVLKKAFSGEL